MALNIGFASSLNKHFKEKPSIARIVESEMYLVHVQDLERRFLRPFGDLLMFGSGECSQLGVDFHYDNEDDEVEDKFVGIPTLLPTLQ